MKGILNRIAGLALLLTACQQVELPVEPEHVSGPEFTAQVEAFDDQTKTAMDGNSVVWNTGDQIAIFQGLSTADKYQVKENGVGNKSATFEIIAKGEGSGAVELPTNVAIYPYESDLVCAPVTAENGAVTSYQIAGVTLPSTQTYAIGSFADGSFPMAALTNGLNDHTLNFKNLCGALKLQLKGTAKIKSIELRGNDNEPLSGEATVTVYPDGSAPTIEMSANAPKTITLDCSEGVQLNETTATDFLITIPPTAFNEGFTVTVSDMNGGTYTKNTGKENNVLRSYILNMPELEVTTELDDIQSLTAKWELGNINTDNGQSGTGTNRRRTIDYIPVKYCWAKMTTLNDDAGVHVIFYDKDYNYVAPTSSTTTVAISPAKNSFFYLLKYKPDGAEYFKIMVRTADANQDAYWEPIQDKPLSTSDIVEWTVGGINVLTGVDTGNNDATAIASRRRTIDYISANKKYVTTANRVDIHVVYYDSMCNYLGTTTKDGTISYLSIEPNVETNLFNDAPEGAVYYRLVSRTSDVAQDGYYKFSTLAQDNSSNASSEIIVDCNGNGDYTTLEEALAYAPDNSTNHVTIRIREGVYYPAPKTPDSTPYKEMNRNLSIIGDDKNKVILKGDVGYYYYQVGIDYAPIRIGGNVTIENLTIESYSSKYTETAKVNGWDLELPHCRAYCIHLDHGCKPGDKIVVKNCCLVNDHFAAIGFGLKQDYTLRIENCDLITTTTDDTLSGFSQYGTLYGHLASGVKTGQRLEVINCRITNVGYSTAINLMDGSGVDEGPEASYLLVGNACETNTENGGSVFKVVNKYWIQDELSAGNNVDAMNFK